MRSLLQQLIAGRGCASIACIEYQRYVKAKWGNSDHCRLWEMERVKEAYLCRPLATTIVKTYSYDVRSRIGTNCSILKFFVFYPFAIRNLHQLS